MSWHARLSLDYTRDGDTTLAHDRHEGPLRVLRRLYPEGPGICHHVLVHPPGGIVGGDTLQVDARLGAGSHAVVTTPGAARFYRSDGAPAQQAVTLALDAGARLEWLPLETIAYRGCIAANRLRLTLAPGAQAMGWDLLALGLPAAGVPFDSGSVLQQIEIPGVWLDRGLIDAADGVLMDGDLGLAGRRLLATLWFAAGEAWPPALAERLLDAARALFDADRGVEAGVTQVQPGVVLLRLLADRVEPAMALCAQVRAAWRAAAWGLAAHPPRIWRT